MSYFIILLLSISAVLIMITGTVSAAPDIHIKFDKVKDRYFQDELIDDEYVLSIKYNNRDIDSDVK